MDILNLNIIFEIARIKAEGHKYETVKKALRPFYDSQTNPLYTYEDLEKKFDYAWANTIEQKPKEELR